VIFGIIQKFCNLGCKAVTITGGGDPLCHEDINTIIKSFRYYGIRVGLVTNADLLEAVNNDTWNSVTWCRISCSDERKMSKKWSNAIKKVSRQTDVDLAFSYVLTKNPDIDNLQRHVEFAEEIGMTHVRVVSDILNAHEVPKIGDINSDLVIMQPRDTPRRGTKDCWISLLKPIIDASGRIFPCCLDENESVLINRNSMIFPEQIKNVSVGDIAEGYGEILNIFEKSGEDILEVVLKNNRTVRVSKDHTMLVAGNLNLVDKKRKLVDYYSLEEVKAQHLRIGDLIPVKYKFNIKENDNLLLTEEAELIGYYLAEGWISNKNNIGFMFGKHEREHINRFEEICNKLCVKFKVYERRTGFQYMIYNKKIHDLLSDCGSKSHLKRVPNYIFTSNYEVKISLLKSYSCGDGHLKMVFSTVSRKLANDLIFLLSTIDVQGTIHIERRQGKAIIENREVNVRDLYSVIVGGKYNLEKIRFLSIKNTGRSPKRALGFLKNEDEGIMFVPVKDILNIKSKKLYDIQVSNSNKFVTSFGIIVHNCGIQYAESEASKDFSDSMCMGSDIDSIWAHQRKFHGSNCDKCYYSDYNNFLSKIMMKLDHVEFV